MDTCRRRGHSSWGSWLGSSLQHSTVRAKHPPVVHPCNARGLRHDYVEDGRKAGRKNKAKERRRKKIGRKRRRQDLLIYSTGAKRRFWCQHCRQKRAPRSGVGGNQKKLAPTECQGHNRQFAYLFNSITPNIDGNGLEVQRKLS